MDIWTDVLANNFSIVYVSKLDGKIEYTKLYMNISSRHFDTQQAHLDTYPLRPSIRPAT